MRKAKPGVGGCRSDLAGAEHSALKVERGFRAACMGIIMIREPCVFRDAMTIAIDEINRGGWAVILDGRAAVSSGAATLHGPLTAVLEDKLSTLAIAIEVMRAPIEMRIRAQHAPRCH